MPYKRPESVLVIIHTLQDDVLLLERADHPGWWQSVTGSLEADETPLSTARRETGEETGIDAAPDQFCDWHEHNIWDIYPCFRHRYSPDITQNTEHIFSLLIPQQVSITLAPNEHLRYRWVTLAHAAQDCFSPTNQAAIQRLAEHTYHD